MSSTTEPTPLATLPPRGGGWRETFWSLVGTVIFGAMLVAMGIFIVPNLVTDWQVNALAQSAPDGQIKNGSCSTHIVITSCDATLSLGRKTNAITRDVSYLFTSVGTGNLSASVLADPARPELVTTDIGLARLWNRTITALVIGGALLALTVTPIVVFLRR